MITRGSTPILAPTHLPDRQLAKASAYWVLRHTAAGAAMDVQSTSGGMRASPRRARAGRGVLLYLLLVALPIHACDTGSARLLRASLSNLLDAGTYSRVLDCIEREEAAINALAGRLKPQSRDELHYFVAQSASNAIHRSGARRLAVAAGAWARYLDGVSAPYSPPRVNFGIGRLLQYARETQFESYWQVLVAGITKVGSQINPDTGVQIVSTLYRCDRWAAPRDSNQIAPCHQKCRTYFAEFLDAAKPAFATPPPAHQRAPYRYFSNIQALEGRLQCDA